MTLEWALLGDDVSDQHAESGFGTIRGNGIRYQPTNLVAAVANIGTRRSCMSLALATRLRV